MHLNFLEIGTSNFRTLIENADDNDRGISVEPLKYYLDQLPNKKNVIKENCAISFDNSENEIKIFFIPEETIDRNQLPEWLKGCNKLNEYHPKHVELNITNLVQIQTVKQIPISKLFEKYNIESLELLKIDTEGGDCDILLNLCQYLKEKSKTAFPKKIIFETNFLTPEDKLQQVLFEYSKLGYKKGKKKKSDTVLILN